MDIEEFFRGLKGNDQDLLGELGGIQKKHRIGKLYLIYVNKEGVIWGLRGEENISDTEMFISDLATFIKRHTGINYSVAEELIVLTNPYSEVFCLLREQVIPHIESHGGKFEVVEIDEDIGLVIVSLEGACGSCPGSVMTMKMGIERILKSLLPWVKEVRSV